jgi:hypothetical protein
MVRKNGGSLTSPTSWKLVAKMASSTGNTFYSSHTLQMVESVITCYKTQN